MRLERHEQIDEAISSSLAVVAGLAFAVFIGIWVRDSVTRLLEPRPEDAGAAPTYGRLSDGGDASVPFPEDTVSTRPLPEGWDTCHDLGDLDFHLAERDALGEFDRRPVFAQTRDRVPAGEVAFGSPDGGSGVPREVIDFVMEPGPTRIAITQERDAGGEILFVVENAQSSSAAWVFDSTGCMHWPDGSIQCTGMQAPEHAKGSTRAGLIVFGMLAAFALAELWASARRRR
jgi:hypothetical protein